MIFLFGRVVRNETKGMINLKVMRTGIKAQTSSNLGRIGLFTLELFALEHRFLIPGAIYMY